MTPSIVLIAFGLFFWGPIQVGPLSSEGACITDIAMLSFTSLRTMLPDNYPDMHVDNVVFAVAYTAKCSPPNQ